MFPLNTALTLSLLLSSSLTAIARPQSPNTVNPRDNRDYPNEECLWIPTPEGVLECAHDQKIKRDDSIQKDDRRDLTSGPGYTGIYVGGPDCNQDTGENCGYIAFPTGIGKRDIGPLLNEHDPEHKLEYLQSDTGCGKWLAGIGKRETMTKRQWRSMEDKCGTNKLKSRQIKGPSAESTAGLQKYDGDPTDRQEKRGADLDSTKDVVHPEGHNSGGGIARRAKTRRSVENYGSSSAEKRENGKRTFVGQLECMRDGVNVFKQLEC